MEAQDIKYGITGYQAPELSKEIQWIDEKGEATAPIQLSNFEGKFKVIYGFQSWCPACHSQGLPALQKMVDALKDNNNIVFFAVQTVFEGPHINTQKRLLETKQRYDLEIPFGHDVGNKDTENRSSIMYHYRTGGTPWFIFINQNGTVVFNDYHLDVEKALEYLTSQG